MATLYVPNAAPLPLEPNNGRKFSLAELQSLVGGYVELVTVGHGNILLVDEDGLAKQLPINLAATDIAQKTIVGRAVFCKRNQI